jgi:hypothetical protein
MADPEFGAFQAKECQNHLENAVLSKLPVEILVGKKNLEVRPTIVNKGEIVKRLLGQHPETEFVMCAGDDKTDEDMFRALAGVSNTQQQQQLQQQQQQGGLTNGNGTNGGSNRLSSASKSGMDQPYNDQLVAETAAKIAEATLAHSLEHHSPMLPHAHLQHHHHQGTHLKLEDKTHLGPSSAAAGTTHAAQNWNIDSCFWCKQYHYYHYTGTDLCRQASAIFDHNRTCTQEDTGQLARDESGRADPSPWDPCWYRSIVEYTLYISFMTQYEMHHLTCNKTRSLEEFLI